MASKISTATQELLKSLGQRDVCRVFVHMSGVQTVRRFGEPDRYRDGPTGRELDCAIELLGMAPQPNSEIGQTGSGRVEVHFCSMELPVSDVLRLQKSPHVVGISLTLVREDSSPMTVERTADTDGRVIHRGRFAYQYDQRPQ